MNSEEEMVAAKCCGVDLREIERVYIDYSPRLINYAFRLLQNQIASEDIVHESFVSVCEKADLLTSANLPALMYAKVRNGCIDFLRHRKVENNYNLSYLTRLKRQEELYNLDFLFDSETPFVIQELKGQIHRIIDSLPPRCREVFVLSRFEGLKNREIATMLNISQTAVEKHITRAMKAFADSLGEYCGMSVCVTVMVWLFGNLQ